jgi:transposase
MTRKLKKYTDEFRKQIVALHKNGKTVKELAEEYDVPKSTIRQWVDILKQAAVIIGKK